MKFLKIALQPRAVDWLEVRFAIGSATVNATRSGKIRISERSSSSQKKSNKQASITLLILSSDS